MLFYVCTVVDSSTSSFDISRSEEAEMLCVYRSFHERGKRCETLKKRAMIIIIEHWREKKKMKMENK